MCQMLLLCVSSELKDLVSHHSIKLEGELDEESISHIVTSSQPQDNQLTGSRLWSEPMTDLNSLKLT